MSKFAKYALVVALCGVCYAQAPDNRKKPDDYFGRAKQMLRELYLGLDPKLRAVMVDENQLSGGDTTDPDRINHFMMELYDQKLQPETCWCSAPSVTARFVFDWQSEAKELVIFAANGPAIRGRTEKFAEEMKKKPRLTDREITSALDAAGAKFGPSHKTDFLRALPLETLRPFTGRLEIVSAEFSLRDGEGHVSPSWSVRAKWRGPDNLERNCYLVFEPFEGKLLSFLQL